LRRCLLVLILLIALATLPALAAEKLTKEYFADPHPELNPSRDYYKPGERLELTYTIKPSTEGRATALDDRYYDIYTTLKNSEIVADVTLTTGAGGTHPRPGDTYEIVDGKRLLSIKIDDTGDIGIYEIKIEVDGVIPDIDERYKEESIFWVNVSDAEDDVLPPVIVKIYNLNKFSDDINSLQSNLSTLSSKIDELKEMGADVSELEDLHDSASNSLSVAEEYYQDGDYANADKKLKGVEEYIEQISNGLVKVRAEYYYDEAENTLDEVAGIVDQIDIYIEDILISTKASRDISSYRTELRLIKKELDREFDKLSRAEDYLTEEKYTEAEEKAKEVLNEANDLKERAQILLDDVKAVLSTSTPESTQTPVVATAMDPLLIVGISVVVALVSVVATMAFMRRRKKWDELK